MSKRITGRQLREALGSDLERLLDEVAEVLSQARPGKIIADSEEPVRDAAAVFRQRLYEKGLELRQQQAGAFSPSADGGSGSLAEQGPADDQLSDGQRPGGDSPDRLLAPRARRHR
jgi:hypothetical protein